MSPVPGAPLSAAPLVPLGDGDGVGHWESLFVGDGESVGGADGLAESVGGVGEGQVGVGVGVPDGLPLVGEPDGAGLDVVGDECDGGAAGDELLLPADVPADELLPAGDPGRLGGAGGVPPEPITPRGVPGSTGGSGGWCAGRPCSGSGGVGSTGTVMPTWAA